MVLDKTNGGFGGIDGSFEVISLRYGAVCKNKFSALGGAYVSFLADGNINSDGENFHVFEGKRNSYIFMKGATASGASRVFYTYIQKHTNKYEPNGYEVSLTRRNSACKYIPGYPPIYRNMDHLRDCYIGASVVVGELIIRFKMFYIYSGALMTFSHQGSVTPGYQGEWVVDGFEDEIAGMVKFGFVNNVENLSQDFLLARFKKELEKNRGKFQLWRILKYVLVIKDGNSLNVISGGMFVYEDKLEFLDFVYSEKFLLNEGKNMEFEVVCFGNRQTSISLEEEMANLRLNEAQKLERIFYEYAGAYGKGLVFISNCTSKCKSYLYGDDFGNASSGPGMRVEPNWVLYAPQRRARFKLFPRESTFNITSRIPETEIIDLLGIGNHCHGYGTFGIIPVGDMFYPNGTCKDQHIEKNKLILFDSVCKI